MIQVRKGVFETNSSSSHSIAIRKDSGRYTEEEIKEAFGSWRWSDEGELNWDGKLTFWGGSLEFDRSPFEPLTTLEDKAKFAIASFSEDPKHREEVERVLSENVPGLKEIEYEERSDRWWDSDGEEKPYYGYVDHQSRGLLQRFLLRHDLTIEDFLMDKKYVVFVDGDEYLITEKLFESGLLKKEDFEGLPEGNYALESEDERDFE